MLRNACNGTDELVQLLLNTTYDEIEENEDEWSDLAETLELSQTEYKIVVSPESKRLLADASTAKSWFFICWNMLNLFFLNHKVSFGFVASLSVALYLIFVTIPSYVSQVLRFRAGVIGSLYEMGFLKLRKNLDTSTTLFASSFWGVSSLDSRRVTHCLLYFSHRLFFLFLLLDSSYSLKPPVTFHIIGIRCFCWCDCKLKFWHISNSLLSLSTLCA